MDSTASGPATHDVTLVVPGRNAARTLALCLEAALELPAGTGPADVVFVDDGSSDGSREIAESLGVRCESAGGRGPGAARNVGWREASTELVWFIDADCLPREGSLGLLLEELADPEVAGVGGSYANAVPESLLARLIHTEIRQRHLAMGAEIDYLGSFNVLYRRSVLDQMGGFDEGWVNGPGAPGAEDADLSYRVAAAGHALRFRADARVAHHHPVSLWSYLRAQRLHGFWGVRLYRRHPDRARGNSYSGLLDHLQPALALVATVCLPLLATGLAWVPLGLAGLLLVSTLPMAARVWRFLGAEAAAFIPLAMLRALARGLGLAWGVLDMLTPGRWKPRR